MNLKRWANLYGAPVSASGKQADMMNRYGESIGSHFRGRILYKPTSYFEREPKTEVKNLEFSFPNFPVPNSKQKTFCLRIDILEGHELPERKKAIVHVSCGTYVIASNSVEVEFFFFYTLNFCIEI